MQGGSLVLHIPYENYHILTHFMTWFFSIPLKTENLVFWCFRGCRKRLVTTQKMNFFIKDIFSKCDQIRIEEIEKQNIIMKK